VLGPTSITVGSQPAFEQQDLSYSMDVAALAKSLAGDSLRKALSPPRLELPPLAPQEDCEPASFSWARSLGTYLQDEHDADDWAFAFGDGPMHIVTNASSFGVATLERGFARESEDSTSPSLELTSSAAQPRAKIRCCKHYGRGHCWYGDSCGFRHRARRTHNVDSSHRASSSASGCAVGLPLDECPLAPSCDGLVLMD
jgi:hypothetical protein